MKPAVLALALLLPALPVHADQETDAALALRAIQVACAAEKPEPVAEALKTAYELGEGKADPRVKGVLAAHRVEVGP